MVGNDWTYQDIIMALRLKGYTLGRVATELGLTYPQARYQIRTGSCEETRAFICRLLGHEPWIIYSSRYPPQWRKQGPPDPK